MTTARGENSWAAILIAILVFSTLSIICAITSTGFLEADGCTHYMYARWAFEYPVYFVDIWGRPIKTLLYAPAAATFGVIGVRLTSLAIAISIAFVANAIAKGQNYRWPALAVIFTFAQPLVFLHSFSELTELPFALLLGLAFLFYQRKQFWLLAIFAGLLPLSRPEGFGFVILVACLLACHRKWTAIPLVVLPVIAWQIAGAILYHEPQNWWNWLPKHWPYAGDSLYAAGPIWHFAALLPAAVGPIVFPFVLLGAFSPSMYSGRGAGGRVLPRAESVSIAEGPPPCLPPGVPGGGVWRALRSSHSFRCDVLIAAIPLMILVGHSVLYAMGKMASNGELRYMLIVAPFWALLATRGWEWVSERFIATPTIEELPVASRANVFSREAATDSSLGRKPQGTSEAIASPEGAKEAVRCVNLNAGIVSAAPSGLMSAPSEPGAYAPGYYLSPLRGWRSPFFWAGIAAILPVFANFGYRVLPLVQTEDWQTAARIAEWYKSSGVAKDYPYIMAAHPGVLFALDVSPLDPALREWSAENAMHPPPGTIAVWDEVYGQFNANADKRVTHLGEVPGWWLYCSRSWDSEHHWSIWLSDASSSGRSTRSLVSRFTLWGSDGRTVFGWPRGFVRDSK